MGWTSAADDTTLVRAYLAGSSAAFGVIYDRYADALHDTAAAMLGDRHDAADLTHDVFVIAAERLGRLRDPAALRAWLFAVLRHEVYGRSRRRRRTRPVDPGAVMAERPAPPDPGAEGAGVVLADLAAELRDAARGLDERDQLVLELTARQGLSGDELATVLGVSVAQSYVVVSRMRDRVARSLDALALARAGRRVCAELDALLAGWNGELTVLVRKRVARHLETCTTCAATRRRLGAVVLLGLAPVLGAPAGLRPRVLDAVSTAGRSSDPSAWRDDGFPRRARSPWPRRLVAGAAAAAVLAAVGFAITHLGDGPADHEVASATVAPTTAPVPGTIAVVGPPTNRDLVAPTAPSTTVAPPTTTLPATTTSAEAVDPPPPPSDPPPTTAITTTGPTTTVELVFVAPTTPDDEPPRVTLATMTSTVPCPPEPAPVVRAAVADASAVTEVVLTWSGPGSPGGASMEPDATDGRWVGDLALDPVAGPWRFVVTATDIAGNAGTAEGTVVVVGC